MELTLNRKQHSSLFQIKKQPFTHLLLTNVNLAQSLFTESNN